MYRIYNEVMPGKTSENAKREKDYSKKANVKLFAFNSANIDKTLRVQYNGMGFVLLCALGRRRLPRRIVPATVFPVGKAMGRAVHTGKSVRGMDRSAADDAEKGLFRAAEFRFRQ